MKQHDTDDITWHHVTLMTPHDTDDTTWHPWHYTTPYDTNDTTWHCVTLMTPQDTTWYWWHQMTSCDTDDTTWHSWDHMTPMTPYDTHDTTWHSWHHTKPCDTDDTTWHSKHYMILMTPHDTHEVYHMRFLTCLSWVSSQCFTPWSHWILLTSRGHRTALTSQGDWTHSIYEWCHPDWTRQRTSSLDKWSSLWYCPCGHLSGGDRIGLKAVRQDIHKHIPVVTYIYLQYRLNISFWIHSNII